MPKIEYNREKLKQILDDIYQLVGVNIAIFDINGNSIYTSGETPEFCKKIQSLPHGKARCYCSDRDMIKKCSLEGKFISHKCHAGITDSVIPIIKNLIIVGYIVIGRVRPNKSFDEIKADLLWLHYNSEEMQNAYESLVTLSSKQFDSLVDLLSNIIFETAIEVEDESFQYRISKFINDNLNKKITVKELCSAMFMSKNMLYENFRNVFGCTVNEYITSERIAKAQELLVNSEDKIRDISEMVGISNYTYFCRLFKTKTGYTPLAYKKKYS